MEYAIIIGLPIAIGAYYVVKRLIDKSYHRGFNDGYYVGIEFDRRMTENAKEYAEIIRKDGDAD